METKYNEATLNRPDGTRIIDAPFVFMDLEKYSQQLKQENAWRKSDRNSITVYKTNEFTMLLTMLQKDAVILDNLVGGHVTAQVLEGAIEFTVETGSLQVIAKQVITIHPGIMHTIKAVKDSLLLIVTTKLCK